MDGEPGRPSVSRCPECGAGNVKKIAYGRLVLGEDHVTVDNDVEDSSTAADQFRFDAGFTLDGGCQTGSPG